jgi:hypothetical protein
MTRHQEMVLGLRRMAGSGQPASVLAAWLRTELGDDLTAFLFMRYFFQAFELPVGALRGAEEWVGFGRGGKLSDDELNLLLPSLKARGPEFPL